MVDIQDEANPTEILFDEPFLGHVNVVAVGGIDGRVFESFEARTEAQSALLPRNGGEVLAPGRALVAGKVYTFSPPSDPVFTPGRWVAYRVYWDTVPTQGITRVPHSYRRWWSGGACRGR